MTEYRLTSGQLTKLQNLTNVKEVHCFRCGKKIVSGDIVHTNSGNRKHSPTGFRVYHLCCWNKLFVVC